MALSGVDQNSRVLEIGCGTGIATRLLAPYGFRMTCLDPAPGMLDVARRTCAAFQNVQFVNTTFEEFETRDHFDLVISAQAFHWINPEIGYPKIAQILKSSGTLALIWNSPQGGATALNEAMARAYAEHAPDLKSPAPGVGWGRTPGMIAATGLFTELEARQYSWSVTYDADTWVALLSTSSDHRVLPQDRREKLFDAFRKAFADNGNALTQPIVSQLHITRVKTELR